jgi:hypothetical protein
MSYVVTHRALRDVPRRPVRPGTCSSRGCETSRAEGGADRRGTLVRTPGRSMMYIRLVIVVVLAILFVGCSGANYATIVRWHRTRQSGSFVPLLGGLAGTGALLVACDSGAYWIWLPLCVDPGCGFIAWCAIVAGIRMALRKA